MAHLSDDRVLETSTTTGTGSYTVDGAVTGFRAFSTTERLDGTAIQTNDTFWYSAWAVDANGSANGGYESGLGTYSGANTVARTTIIRSSNADAAVSWSAGTKYVAITLIAARTVQLDNENVATLPATTAPLRPTTPASGFLKLFAQTRGGLQTLRTIGPTGVDHSMQRSLSENGFSAYFPNNGTTAGLNIGLGWTSGGTVSHPTPSSTAPAICNQQKRTRWANIATTTNQVLGLRTATAEKRYWRGNAAGLGGWNFHARFAIGLWPAATVRLFVGLNDSNTGWVASDTLAGNGCGLWHDTTEAATVLNFVRRDNTTTTKTAITLATALAAGQCFDFWMGAKPNGGEVYYTLIEQNTGTLLADSNVTTNIPLNTAFMGQELAMSNGTANTTVTTTAFDLAGHSVLSNN